MRRKMCMTLALVFVITGLMFTASCAKKTIKAEEALLQDTVMPRQTTPRTSERDKLARQQAIEQERLRQEQFRQEQERQLRSGQTSDRGTMAERRSVMAEDILFDYDSATLSSMAQDILRQKAEWARNHSGVSVVIEGHCDERGTNEYNLALGDRRAESAKSFLVHLGISPSQLTTISYGEERPLDPGSNEHAWRKNRRAHFVAE